MSRLPHYRIMPERASSCACTACLQRQRAFDEWDMENAVRREEAASYAEAFAKDHWEVCALSGHIHRHHDTCFKYVGDSVRRKPQHCRFGFVHFARLWLPKTTDSEGAQATKEILVERVLARVGKEPVLPRQPGDAVPDIYADPIVATKDLFHTSRSLGACVEADDRQARRGRIKTVQFNPREGTTTMGGVIAHRANLDYQDCRRTFVDGFEENEDALDVLRCSSEDAEVAAQKSMEQQSGGNRRHVAPYKTLDLNNMDRFAPAFWKAFSERHSSSTAAHDDDAALPLSVAAFWDTDTRKAVCRTACRFSFYFQPRLGTAEIPRVGDRLLSVTARWMRKMVLDSVTETIRSGIQTPFYTCDYSTKPNMTCAPLLKHTTHGMEHLEATMKEEAAREQLEELVHKGVLDGAGFTGTLGGTTMTPDAPAAAPTRKPLSKEQDEARRRLIRLWTSANSAVVKGCCLMAIQLLTGREVIRTHPHWRLMMKRPIWSAQEALRQLETVSRRAALFKTIAFR